LRRFGAIIRRLRTTNSTVTTAAKPPAILVQSVRDSGTPRVYTGGLGGRHARFLQHTLDELRGETHLAPMTRTIALLLLLTPACSTALGGSDSAPTSDAGLMHDAVVVGSDGEIIHPDSGLDAAMADDAFVAATNDSGHDAAAAIDDAGHDAAMFSGDAWAGICGDGFIDPPETCDPGSAHSSLSCPTAGSTGACRWCRYGLTPAGCVYGDYLYIGVQPTTWASSCRSTTSVLSWVVWHSAAERDAIIAAYRSIGAGGGTTDVSGWIGLWAHSDTASFQWGDDGSALNAETILPFHNTRGPGTNCVTLTVTDTDAYFTYVPCSGGGRTALCFTQPWGTPR
jgi:hypothetical protein